MRKLTLIAGLCVAVMLALLWASGGLESLRLWALESQRQVQDQMAGAVRALRGGQPGALIALLGVTFAYGVLHAVGPGHGKMLIGGYGLARRVRLLPLSLIALVASLAQATVAVLLVYAFVLALGWTRERVEGVADTVLLTASQVVIGVIGLWLVWRGIRGLQRHQAAPSVERQHTVTVRSAASHGHAVASAEAGPGGYASSHAHSHGHHEHDESCGHAHGPTLQDMEQVHSLRDALLLVFGIAIRPCSGALFLLIITWTLGIAGAGIAGVYAMGLGTALVTTGVAALSIWAREGALATLTKPAVARAIPILELGVGAVIALVAVALLTGSA